MYFFSFDLYKPFARKSERWYLFSITEFLFKTFNNLELSHNFSRKYFYKKIFSTGIKTTFLYTFSHKNPNYFNNSFVHVKINKKFPFGTFLNLVNQDIESLEKKFLNIFF